MTAPTMPANAAGSGFFEWIRLQGLSRGPDRWFGGVASGIARRIGWDPVLVRGLFVVAAIFSGIGPLLYGAAWLLLPEAADGRVHLEELVLRGRLSAGFWGGAIFAFVGLVETPTWLGIAGVVGFALMAAIVAGGLVLLAYAGSQGRQAAGAPATSPPAHDGAPPPAQSASATNPVASGGSAPATAPPSPDATGGEPDTTGGKPDTAGGEPDTTGGEPAAGGEPDTGGEPD
ncbi:MAG: PspC domain-containing protein, partial [Bifidobacteriaceae bacterium]|nr:PspC domain-containing protein [Bifidobacteriaceae bacterium]